MLQLANEGAEQGEQCGKQRKAKSKVKMVGDVVCKKFGCQFRLRPNFEVSAGVLERLLIELLQVGNQK